MPRCVRSAGGIDGYHFGYPAYSGGGVEPDVVLQWAGGTYGLGATSDGGDIVDSVASVSLPKVNSPTYRRSPSDSRYSEVSPGIDCSPANAGFAKGAPDAAGNLATSDATLEVIYNHSASGGGHMFSTLGALATSGFEVSISSSGFTSYMKGDLGTVSNLTFIMSTNPTLGDEHKVRYTFDRDGYCTVIWDGVSQGSQSIAGLAAENISAEDLHVGTNNGNTSEFEGVLSEVRLSLNLTNNSGGPGGG